MELYQLNYFLEVVEARSITGAAQKLRLAQPALSQQIQKLEEELGTALLIRGRRETVPTYAGQLLMERARLIREMVAQTQQSISDLVELRSGSLSIATIPTVSSKLLPDWIVHFRRSHPNVDLILREGTSAQVEQWVVQGLCEIGFTQLPTAAPGLMSTDIKLDRFCVLVPSSHFLTERHSTVFSRLRGQPMILYRGGKLANFILSRCRAVNWEPKIICETSEFETLRALVAVGLGIAIVPEIAAHSPVNDASIVAIPLKDHAFHRRIGLIIRGAPKPSPAAQAFIHSTQP